MTWIKLIFADPTLVGELLADVQKSPALETDYAAWKAGTLSLAKFVTAHKDALAVALLQTAQELIAHPNLAGALLDLVAGA